jgi:hypothetical protein
VSVRFLLAGIMLLPALNCFGQGYTPVGSVPAPAVCRLFDPVANTPDSSAADGSTNLRTQLLAIYNNQAHLTQTVKAVAEVRVIRGPKFGKSAGKSRVIGSFMDFEQPAWLRVIGVVPLAGTKIFDLSSDGREFRLMAPDHDKMTLFIGPSESEPDFTAGSLNLRPQEFLDALRWEEGKLAFKSESRPAVSSQSFMVDIDLPSRTGKSVSGKLQFDLTAGTVSSLRIYNATGEILSELAYADWRAASGAPGQTKEDCFPHHVRVIHPVEDYQIDIRFLEVARNSPLPRADFRFKPPHGIPVVRVSETGNKEQ